MKRYLPLAIIVVVLVMAVGIGVVSYRQRTASFVVAASDKPGAQPPHIRGTATAPVTLEEFGDFECLPCFLLWPAVQNLEKDYGKDLAVIFRERPLPQHSHAPDAARAAEAAGVQGKFWEMHDMLYMNRGKWVRAADPKEYFRECAATLGLDVDKFVRDAAGPEVAQRLQADAERAVSLKIDRTPAVFLNGRRVQLEADVENGIRSEIEAALGRDKQK